MVDVAQLGEPRIVIPVVAGSIPVVHPITPSIFYFFLASLFLSGSIFQVKCRSLILLDSINPK